MEISKMKYALGTTEPPKVENSFGALALAEMQNDLMSAYESLDASVKELAEVQSLMSNVQSSLNLLAKYGDAAIPQLNLDKGLEELLGVPEKLITAQKAVEAMEEADKGFWAKLKEKVIAVWNWLREYFNKAYEYIVKKITGRVDTIAEAIKSLKPDEMKTYGHDHKYPVYIIKSERANKDPLGYVGSLLGELSDIVKKSARELGSTDASHTADMMDLVHPLQNYGFEISAGDPDAGAMKVNPKETVSVELVIDTPGLVQACVDAIQHIRKSCEQCKQALDGADSAAKLFLKQLETPPVAGAEETSFDKSVKNAHAHIVVAMASTVGHVVALCTKLADAQSKELVSFVNGIVQARGAKGQQDLSGQSI